ncbi:uncharacterized protein LOC126373979 [Pectinophora gossypiella]|uniref:uncharacterized protein LOC126373979 n=1 Tax=Pectinophora gossypiella TaxID=13191 RepID=UPI00214EEF3F|nr:uncharacterized protein LOC126373979 [Pectinophora gossypiella]
MNTDLNVDVELTNDYHLGHFLLDCFKKRGKDHFCQIDASIDDKQTYETALNLTVRLARSLKNMGYQPGDVILMGGTNHVKVRIPFFAGMMIGLPVCGVDPLFKCVEIKTLLNITQAKLAFCDYVSYDYYKQAAEELGLDLKIVTFDKGDFTFEDLLSKYDDNEPIEEYRPLSFDIDKVHLWLMSTSGTTGPPKIAAIKHKSALPSIKEFMKLGIFGSYLKEGQQAVLCVAPVQWVSSYVLSFGTIMTGNILLISAKYNSVDVLIDMINKYRPVVVAASPPLFGLILRQEKHCDFTCFDRVILGGATVYKELADGLKARMREDAYIAEAYGQTEMMALSHIGGKDTPIGSCGQVIPGRQVKLVDPDTYKEITEPNVPGQLLYKGPMISEYYRNPEETAKVFTEDGWLKSGDKLYRDEDGNYYFVERLKMLFKYRTIQISPTEIEEVILTLPGVLEVCVTSIDHPIDQQWPVAVVVKRPGYDITAQEIKNIVEEKLSDSKKLRGGVVFMDQIPKTSTGKVARNQIRTMVKTATRE